MADMEAIDVQRQTFQLKFDKVIQKLKLIKLRSETFRKTLKILKARKVTQDEQSANNTSAEKKIFTLSGNKTEWEK